MFELPEFYKDFTADLNLNQENIRWCNDNSHFSPGLSIAGAADGMYKKFFQRFPDLPIYTDEQRAYLLGRAAKWRELVEQAYNEELRRRAVFVPVNVAGPAKYDFAKANKQVERDIRNRNEWDDKMTSFLSNTAENLARLTPIDIVIEEIRSGMREDEVVTADDKYAMQKLNARLEYLLETQADMKAANKHYRKHGTMKGFTTNEAKAERWDKEITTHFSWEQCPFPTYELTSINGKIKRVKERIEHITKLLTEKPFEDFEFEGGKVVANYTEDRLQVFFDSKPDEETRAQMKSNGFRWAPSSSAWQRQLTRNAYSVAKQLFSRKEDNQ